MMKKLPITLSLILFLFSQSTFSVQVNQAEFWLKKMMHAVHQLNYDGYFVYFHGSNIESLRTVHIFKDGHEIERLFSLNGEAREIVRDDDTVTCILPNEKAISTTERLINQQYFSGFFEMNPEIIEKNYQIVLQGQGRVADRTSNIIIFKPKDNLRYGYELNIDDEYGLPLQWDMFNEAEEVVSRIMFTQISIGEDIEDSGPLMNPKLPSIVHSVEKQKPSKVITNNVNNVPFVNIPHGFDIKLEKLGLPRQKDRDVEHYIFSDGIASFSVYLEKTDKIRLKGKAQLGALNAFGVYKNGYQITAVGEVPARTLVFINEMKLTQ